MNLNNLTIRDSTNAVQLNGVKSISTGDLEMESKSENAEKTMANGSTVVLVQHSNQEFPEKRKTQGIHIFVCLFYSHPNQILFP